jgi:hypothetical protein
MRFLVVASAISLSAIGLTLGNPAAASIRKNVSVQPQGLTAALQIFARESGLHLVYIEEDVTSRKSPGASGELTPEEALKRVLKGTGLTYKYLDGETVSIVPVSKGAGFAGAELPRASTQPAGLEGQGDPSLWDRFRVAEADQGGPSVASSSDGGTASSSDSSRNSSDRGALSEIIVTAQKREEREQDVPVAMTVLDPKELAENGQNRLVDYFASVPGLSMNASSFGPGTLYITIRGLSSTCPLARARSSR